MSTRKKGFIYVVFVIIFVLTSISKPESASAPPTSSPTPPRQARERLVFFALQPGTSIFATNVGLSQLVNKYTKLKTIVQPYPSSITRFDNLRRGNVDLATATAVNAYAFIYNIKLPTEPNVKEPTPEARFLLGGNNLYYGWTTRPDTGIKTIADLKGRRVTGQVPGQASLRLFYEQTLLAYGINKDDVRHIPFDNTPATVEALQDGKVDATFTSLGGAKIEEAVATKNAFALPFPPEKRQFLTEKPELVKIHLLPAKHLSVLREPTPVIGIQNFLVCRSDLPEASAYMITKAVLEHAEELVSVSVEFKEWGLKQAIPPDFFVPYHPGAIKYFKEKKMWNAGHDARQKENLEKIAKIPRTK